jgi:hypothetical protein
MFPQFERDLWRCDELSLSRFSDRTLQMNDNPSLPTTAAPERKPLSEAAKRALAEAEARRTQAVAKPAPAVKETGGPQGPEPTRFGDWERKGIASDF